MISIETFRQIALSFPETTEQPHFEKTSFRVGKKIFATVDIGRKQATVKLSEIDQNVFSSFDKSIIYPVPSKWGRLGWSIVDLERLPETMITDLLKTAYCEVAPPRLVSQIN